MNRTTICILLLVLLWPFLVCVILRLLFVSRKTRYLLPIICSLIGIFLSTYNQSSNHIPVTESIRTAGVSWLIPVLEIGSLILLALYYYFIGLLAVLLVDAFRRIAARFAGTVARGSDRSESTTRD